MSEMSIEKLRDLAVAAHAVRDVEGHPVALVPDSYSLEDLEHLLDAPRRARGVTKLVDLASFIAVVNEFKTRNGIPLPADATGSNQPDAKAWDAQATRLFYIVAPAPSFVAVFNGTISTRDVIETGWGDHRATYDAPLSVEWKTWLGSDGKRTGQEDFAQFIENNLPDIITPDGAELLEIASSLQATKAVKFSSGVRLSNGENQFTYEEQVDGSAAKGTLKVPEEFTIAIPVFEGGDPWQIQVRLRYRIAEGGKLTLWYELIRAHKVVEAAVADVITKIQTETGLPLLRGTPPAKA